MKTVEPEVDRYLTLLRNKIREQGFTQLEVQESLGWGRSYISQLLTKQKSLRVEQVLLILSVVGIDPREYFQQLYGASIYRGASPRLRAEMEDAGELQREVEDLRTLVHGLADLLLGEGLITADDLSSAVETIGQEPEPGAGDL